MTTESSTVPPERASPPTSLRSSPISAAPYCEDGVAQMIEVKVPDIGDFKDVEIIEVLVKPGDRVEKETSLITLESDKATVEIPSPLAAIVRELRIKIGDKVSQGSPILLLEESAGAAVPSKPARAPAAAAAPTLAPAKPAAQAPAPGAFKGTADVTCDMLVLGSGPGGYSAAFRAADLGLI